MVDLAGLDISWRVRKRRNAERPPLGRYSKVADRLCEMGRFGQKTGSGFYKYEAGNRTPVPDPEVEALIRDYGTRGRNRTAQSHRRRDSQALHLRARQRRRNVLADGIAIRAGDVDVVWVYGYAFPSWRGGPLRYAQSVGLRAVYDDILAFQKAHGVYWTPAPLLEKLAKSGGAFT